MTDHLTPDVPHFVYEMRDETGALLYIGCTWNLGSRLNNHRSQRPWFDEVASFSADRFPDQRSALDEERSRIERLSPKYNSVFTERYDAGGWAGRRRRMADAHAAGRFCGDNACRACIDKAHGLGVACRNRTWPGPCEVCRDYPPFYSLLSEQERREHPDWEPLWEQYLDRMPTDAEMDAYFAEHPLTPVGRSA